MGKNQCFDEDAKSWKIEIPGYILPSVNRLLNMPWQRRKRIKVDATDTILWHCFLAKVPNAQRQRRVGFLIELADMRKAPDADNCWKILLDSLVAGRILIDDRSEYVQQGRHDIEKSTRTQTTIFIEDV